MNIAAIGALVAGVVGMAGLLPGLLGIIAVCCAVVGHRQGSRTGRGTKLALVGLILGVMCLVRVLA